MPILIQCTSCQRTLRVQDSLMGKTIKCPNCLVKFLAKAIEPTVPLTPEMAPTPQLLPTQPAAPALQLLEISEPASTPPRAEGIVPAAAVPPPSPSPPMPPAEPQPFETPPLRVFAIVGAIVLAAALVGWVLGWWLGDAVEQTAAAAAAADNR